MAEITASMVKELRERTGAGMMDCKKALTEADGDMDAAVDILRTQGPRRPRQEGRPRHQRGRSSPPTSRDDGKIGALVEVNCETDFVGAQRRVPGVRDRAGRAGRRRPRHPDGRRRAHGAAVVSATATLTVEQALGELVGKLGENMGVAASCASRSPAPAPSATYVHGGGTHRRLVEYRRSPSPRPPRPRSSALAQGRRHAGRRRQPLFARREEVPADVVEHELSHLQGPGRRVRQARGRSRRRSPQGRLEKFYKEVCSRRAALREGPGPDGRRSYVAEVSKARRRRAHASSRFDRAGRSARRCRLGRADLLERRVSTPRAGPHTGRPVSCILS